MRCIQKWGGLGRAHRGMASITASSGAGQMISLAVTPILSRLYPPEAFGAFAALMAVTSIAAIGGTMRLETAVPIASHADATSLARTSFWSSLLAGMLACIVVFGWSGTGFWRASWPNGLLVVFLVLIGGMYSVLTNYSLRSRNYPALARRNLWRRIGTSGGQVLAAPWLNSASGLVAGAVIGGSLGLASLVRESGLLAGGRVRARAQVVALRRYWRFPVLFMPAALLNAFGVQIPLLLVTSWYGAESAGNLAQALRLGAVPAMLLGAAASSVILGELSTLVRNGQLNQRARYLRVSRALAPVALAWFLLLTLAGPWAAPLILGSAWPDVGSYVAAVAYSSAAGLLVAPLSVVLIIYERAALNFTLDLGRVVLVFGAGVAAWAAGDGPVEAVLAMAIAMALVYGVTWLVGLRVVSQ